MSTTEPRDAQPSDESPAWLPETSRRKFLLSTLAVAAGASAIVGSAAARPARSQGAAAKGAKGATKTSATLAISGPVRTIDPDGKDQNYIPSLSAMWACCDNLVNFSIPKEFATAQSQAAKGLKPQPLLAESWTVTKGGTVYTFKLRKGVMSQYGNELTADGVVWMVEKTLAAKATGAFLGGVIMGLADKSQVTALDKYTVRFTLKAPNPTFLLGLGLPWFPVYDTVEVKKHITADDPYAAKWLAKNTAGFGPYMIESIGVGGNVTRLKARSDYWGAQPIPSIVQQNVSDPSARLQLILKGSADYAEQLSALQMKQVEKKGGQLTRFTSTTGSMLILGLKAPFDDPKIRQAIAKAIPYDDIVKVVYQGNPAVQAWKSPFAPWVQGYTGAYGYSTDAAAAAAGLASIKGTKLTLSYSGSEGAAEQIGIVLQSALNKAGLDVSLEKLLDADYVQKINKRTLPNFIATVQGPPLFPIPSYYFQLLFSKTGFNNYNGYASPAIEALIPKMLAAATPAQSIALAKQGQKIVMNDLPIIPIAYTGEVRATTKGLSIERSHTGNGLLYWQDFAWA